MHFAKASSTMPGSGKRAAPIVSRCSVVAAQSKTIKPSHPPSPRLRRDKTRTARQLETCRYRRQTCRSDSVSLLRLVPAKPWRSRIPYHSHLAKYDLPAYRLQKEQSEFISFRAMGEAAVKGSGGDGTINLTMGFAACNVKLRALLSSSAQSHT